MTPASLRPRRTFQYPLRAYGVWNPTRPPRTLAVTAIFQYPLRAYGVWNPAKYGAWRQ